MHHATLYIGERAEVEEEIKRELDKLGHKIVGNPDVFVIESETLSVEDARDISERAIQRAFVDKKFFIIKATRFTIEAQNALLKTLEDPTENTHFIISARETGLFLPTLLSRLQVVHVGGELEESEAKKFLKKGLKQRLDFAKKFSTSLPDFLDSLLIELRAQQVSLNTLKKVLAFRAFSLDIAAQPRLILEHLALVL